MISNDRKMAGRALSACPTAVLEPPEISSGGLHQGMPDTSSRDKPRAQQLDEVFNKLTQSSTTGKIASRSR